MDLSVIIVNYNVRHFLEQCLNSVMKASASLNAEIIVVDNNSTDGSCAMVKTRFPSAKLIMNERNRGFSAANNQALKIAGGEYILLLNPDTLVEEDTFIKCISFMNEHPDAGALGVKMIDGKGMLLPESKRALPTPKTALFRVTGLSWLFPKSRYFNRYYLGHIDDSETSPTDILSGAFMFLRKEAVTKTGMLDEDYFMYGEDVDYSYRLLKAGYRNYYYPKVRIIHYKGQSTKKEHINTYVNFYRAMMIFVKKHFSNGTMKHFIFLIHSAILITATIAFIRNILTRISLVITDSIVIYLILRFSAQLWGIYKFGEGYQYPNLFISLVLPCYVIVFLVSVALFRGYRLPARILNALRGLLAGMLIILTVYGLLPADLRFSRAVILIGSIAIFVLLPFYRYLVSLIIPALSSNPFSVKGNSVIVADYEGFINISKLLKTSEKDQTTIHRVSITNDDISEDVLGNINQLVEIVRVNDIRQIVFSSHGINTSQIIDAMHSLSEFDLNIRIASADYQNLVGSRQLKY